MSKYSRRILDAGKILAMAGNYTAEEWKDAAENSELDGVHKEVVMAIAKFRDDLETILQGVSSDARL